MMMFRVGSLFQGVSYSRLSQLSQSLRALHGRRVLGIETSCDDTGIAILTENGHILSEVCASQVALHVSNGGIIPPVARDMHRSVIDRCVVNCFETAQISPRDLSAIAVTLKPGLPLSLVVGCRYAKKLSVKYDIPIIPIHHMEAHALAAMLEYPPERLDFPFLSLLISGGHSLICYVNDLDDFRLMGSSLDDAPGDILDKLARELRLKNLGPPYNQVSGGAAIEIMSKGGDPFSHFERHANIPLFSRLRTCNFSFSGFLNAATRAIRRLEEEADLAPDAVLPQAHDVCASILYVLSFTFVKRLQRAFQFLEEREMVADFMPKRLVVSGGCAANKFFSRVLTNYCQHEGIELFIPSPKLCTDNGLMIAWNGALKLKHEDSFPHFILRDQKQIQALDVDPRAPLGVDISKDVTNANIKCEKIDVKSFIKLSAESNVT